MLLRNRKQKNISFFASRIYAFLIIIYDVCIKDHSAKCVCDVSPCAGALFYDSVIKS